MFSTLRTGTRSITSVLLLLNLIATLTVISGYETLIIGVSFIVNKQVTDFAEYDKTAIENAFKVLVIDICGNERADSRLLRGDEQHRRSLITNVELDDSTIEVVDYLPCPKYATDDFRYCRLVEAKYNVIEQTDTGDNMRTKRLHKEATINAINDGTLQTIFDEITPHFDLYFIGDPETVASEFSILPANIDLYSIHGSFNIFSGTEMNNGDAVIIQNQFKKLVEKIGNEIEPKAGVVTIDNEHSNIEVYGFNNCPAGIAKNGWCTSAVYKYNILVQNAGSETIGVRDQYYATTYAYIHDGIFGRLLASLDLENPMYINEP